MTYKDSFIFEKSTLDSICSLMKDFGATYIVLFGSVLSGYMMPWSDLDMMIVKDSIENKKDLIKEFLPYRNALYQLLDRSLDVTVISVEKFKILQKDFLDWIEYRIIAL